MMARMKWDNMRSRGLRILAASACMAVLAGCGLRLESPEPEWPSPSVVTLERDQAALYEYFITQKFGSPAVASDGARILEEATARTVPAHLEALGGVYRAYEDDELPVFDGSLADAVLAARDGAWEISLLTDDADLSALTASISLSHSLAWWWSDWHQADVDVDVVQERLFPVAGAAPGSALVPEAALLDGETLMDLAVLHDQARYLYETIGARAQDQERDLAYARRDIHRARSDDLAALADVGDRREAIYSIVAADVTGGDAQADTARATEIALGMAYAAVMTQSTVQDKPWLASGAFDAFAAAAVLPGFTMDQWPVLPGIAVRP